MSRVIGYSSRITEFSSRIIKFIDKDADIFLQATGIPQTSEAIYDAVDDLTTSLKDTGLWVKMKAIYPFVGGTATTHKFNLKDPRDLDAAYRLTFTGGLTHSSTGMLPNGTTGYASTYFAFSTLSNANSNSLTYYSRTNSSVSTRDIGAVSAGSSNGNELRIYQNPYFYGFSNEINAAQTATGLTTSAFFGVSRTANNLLSIFKNSTRVSTYNVINNLLPANTSVYIGAVNNAGTAVGFTPRECAFATMGDGLTDAEMVILYNIIQNFQTKLGRAV